MKKLTILLLALLLPMISLAQSAVSRTESAAECRKKADEYYKKKEYKQAVEWYQKGANQGHAWCQFRLGWLYNNGYGVTKDYAKAVEWYQKAANQGDGDAQNNLGYMYESGRGVSKDYAKAVAWYQKAANQGHTNAQCNLGYMYENGYGVTKDYVKAVELYQKGADQGHARSQFRLGWMYYKGYGVTKNDAKAVEWYQKAANQGNASAQCNLGYMYRNGRGVTKDYAKAIEWYQKADNQGDATAQNNLGLMYENGNGVSKDYTKALELYQKAANQGYEKAKNNLASLQKKMAEEKNALAQTTTTSTQKPVEKSKEQKTVSPKPIPQPTIGIDLVDTDIPVIGRVNKNTFAIIIANEDYQVETKVDYAKNDGEVFKNYCHRTLGLPEKNVHFVANATRNNIIGELYWLSQVCKAYKGEANVIFYYAGHGLPDEDSGSAYLLPVDGNSQLLPTCYSINELYATLGSLPAKKVTVLMDACFSGAKRSGGMLASARGVAIKAKAASPKGSMIVLSAAQGNETAYKYEEAKHGLFTYFLLKKLKDSKGNVTMGELSNYIQDQVGRYSIVENGKSQTPSVMTSDNLRSSWKGLTFY